MEFSDCVKLSGLRLIAPRDFIVVGRHFVVSKWEFPVALVWILDTVSIESWLDQGAEVTG